MIVKFKGFGSIWDPERARSVAHFEGGELITDDPRLIELGRLNHFEEEILEADPAPIVEPEAKVARRKAKSDEEE